jgi:hypothetical protein
VRTRAAEERRIVPALLDMGSVTGNYLTIQMCMPLLPITADAQRAGDVTKRGVAS